MSTPRRYGAVGLGSSSAEVRELLLVPDSRGAKVQEPQQILGSGSQVVGVQEPSPVLGPGICWVGEQELSPALETGSYSVKVQKRSLILGSGSRGAKVQELSPTSGHENRCAKLQERPLTLGPGSRGPSVQELQRQLAAAGFDPGPVDGIYGPLTARAVRELKRYCGLTVSGSAGSRTESGEGRAPCENKDAVSVEDIAGAQKEGVKGRSSSSKSACCVGKDNLSAEDIADLQTKRALELLLPHQPQPGRQLSPHFAEKEFCCRCGCGLVRVNVRLVDMLEELRACLGGRPVVINSGYRCPEHNRAVGGVRNSQHLAGNAADVVVAGVSPSEVAATAKKAGFPGVGRYSNFTHVDVRPNDPARWGG